MLEAFVADGLEKQRVARLNIQGELSLEVRRSLDFSDLNDHLRDGTLILAIYDKAFEHKGLRRKKGGRE